MPQAVQGHGEVRPLSPGGQALTRCLLINPAGGVHPGDVSGHVTRRARRGTQQGRWDGDATGLRVTGHFQP